MRILFFKNRFCWKLIYHVTIILFCPWSLSIPRVHQLFSFGCLARRGSLPIALTVSRSRLRDLRWGGGNLTRPAVLNGDNRLFWRVPPNNSMTLFNGQRINAGVVRLHQPVDHLQGEPLWLAGASTRVLSISVG